MGFGDGERMVKNLFEGKSEFLIEMIVYGVEMMKI